MFFHESTDINEIKAFFTHTRRQLESLKKVRETMDEYIWELEKYSGESGFIVDFFYELQEREQLEITDKKCFVYYILNEERNKVKIGISGNPLARAKAIQTSSGEEISILKTIEYDSSDEARKAEGFLHREFSEYRKRPSKVAKSCEWFDAAIVDDLLKYYSTKENIDKIQKFRLEQDCEAMRKLEIAFGR